MNEYLEKSRQYKGFHYSDVDVNELNYLHDTTLDMLKKIVNIFEINHIRYMVCGGTLLGAVTAQKFIPWDDDVDICVLEDDYEKMKDILLKELQGEFFVQCKETEPNYYHSWIKIRDYNSKVYPSEPLYMQNGVWVDIYKLIKTKRRDAAYRINKEHLDYLIRRKSGGYCDKRIFEATED